MPDRDIWLFGIEVIWHFLNSASLLVLIVPWLSDSRVVPYWIVCGLCELGLTALHTGFDWDRFSEVVDFFRNFRFSPSEHNRTLFSFRLPSIIRNCNITVTNLQPFAGIVALPKVTVSKTSLAIQPSRSV